MNAISHLNANAGNTNIDGNEAVCITAWLSLRIWHNRTTADLAAMGIELTGEQKGNFIEAILPAGWSVIQSEVSMFQRQVIDAQGKIRIRLYDQPGSAGGGTEMCFED